MTSCACLGHAFNSSAFCRGEKVLALLAFKDLGCAERNLGESPFDLGCGKEKGLAQEFVFIARFRWASTTWSLSFSSSSVSNGQPRHPNNKTLTEISFLDIQLAPRSFGDSSGGVGEGLRSLLEWKISFQWWYRKHRGSILASHPAAPRSKCRLRYSLQYWDWTHLVLK